MGSIEDDAPVDVERLPGDVPGAGGSQKDSEGGDVLGVLGRPSGMPAFRRRAISSTLRPSSRARERRLSSESAVTVVPGQMAFTLMLCLASCRAAMRVRLMTAPLLAA